MARLGRDACQPHPARVSRALLRHADACVHCALPTPFGWAGGARGQRVSYVRNKDLLVLEGDSRGQAEIWKKPLRSNTLPDAIAGKILYRPHDNHIEVDRAQRFEWVNPNAPSQAKNPQPKRKS